MSVKQQVVSEIFRLCRKQGSLVFHNNLVKKVSKDLGFGNPFDATKLDDTTKLPQLLLDEDYFIVHLGKGNHQFVKGVKNGYHTFETIPDECVKNWPYRKSILNEFDTSESNILSVAQNQRIIHDFLYEDIVASPKVYNARRTNTSFSYKVGKTPINATGLQMEIDLTMELQRVVTVFEGKNRFPKDFAVYQLFHPFKYYSQLKIQQRLDLEGITCCYILRKRGKERSVLRLYNYTFTDPDQMASIKLLDSAQYNLIKR